MKSFVPFMIILALCQGLSARGNSLIGTAIIKVPYTISKSGDYRLAGNLTMTKSTSSAITISASNVVLDLNGYTLTAGTAANIATVYGIDIAGANVTVRDGTIVGFGRSVNDYNGNGFDSPTLEDLTCQAPVGTAAIYLDGADTVLTRVRVTNPTRAISAPIGIYANLSSNITSCSVSDLHAAAGQSASAYVLDDGPGDGEYTALLRDSVASNCEEDGGAFRVILCGAANSIADRCYFFNITGGCALGGNGNLTIKNSDFRSCGSTPLSGVTNGGGNTIEP